MAKIYKVNMYIIDCNDMINDIDEVTDIIERKFSAFTHVGECKNRSLEWNDDLQINQVGATTKDHEEYFDENETIEDMKSLFDILRSSLCEGVDDIDSAIEILNKYNIKVDEELFIE